MWRCKLLGCLTALILTYAFLLPLVTRLSGGRTARPRADGGEGASPLNREEWKMLHVGRGRALLVLGVVSVGTGGDYRSANVTKNLVVFINSAVVAAFFAVQAIVAWPQALVMMAGVPLGAVLGLRIARVLPNAAARGLVVGIGALLTLAFAWRYWL